MPSPETDNATSRTSDPSTQGGSSARGGASGGARDAVRGGLAGMSYDDGARQLAPRPVQQRAGAVQRTAAVQREDAGKKAIAEAEGMATQVGGPGKPDTSPWGKGVPEPSGKSYFDVDPLADMNGIGQGPATVPQGPENQMPGGSSEGAANKGGASKGGAAKGGAAKGGASKRGAAKAGAAKGSGDPGAAGAGQQEAAPEEVEGAENPDIDLDLGGDRPPRPELVPIGGKIKGSFTFKRKVNKDLKYATIDSVSFKIDFEASVPGSIATIGAVGKGEASGGKTKGKPGGELMVPVHKIKPDFAGGELTLSSKGGWETTADKTALVAAVDAKCGWAFAEIKIELVGLDESKGVVPPKVKVSAGGTFARDFMVEGYKMNVTAKCSAEVEVSPNYAALAQKGAEVLGRGASTGGAGAGAAGGGAGTAAAAAGGEEAATGLSAVGTGEILFAAGMLTIPATMVYALYRDAGDIAEMKAAGKRADEAAGQFISGYLAAFGIGSAAGDLGSQGKAAGEAQVKARLAAMERNYESIRKAYTAKHGKDDLGPFTEEDRVTCQQAMMRKVKENAAVFREGAKGAFYWWIHSEIYNAWRKEKMAKDGSIPADQDERVRLYVMGSEKVRDKPEWDKFLTAWRTMGYGG